MVAQLGQTWTSFCKIIFLYVYEFINVIQFMMETRHLNYSQGLASRIKIYSSDITRWLICTLSWGLKLSHICYYQGNVTECGLVFIYILYASSSRRHRPLNHILIDVARLYNALCTIEWQFYSDTEHTENVL